MNALKNVFNVGSRRCLVTTMLAGVFLTVEVSAYQAIRWRPVGANVSHTIIDRSGLPEMSEIILHSLPAQVTLEIHIESDLIQLEIAGYQGTLDSSGYGNGIGSDLGPCGGCCPGSWVYARIDTWRPDFVFWGYSNPCSVFLGDLDYEYACDAMECRPYPAGSYAGTLEVCVPKAAAGTYELGWVELGDFPWEFKTFIRDCNGMEIPIYPAPVKITIDLHGKCCWNIGPGTTMCDDGLTEAECAILPAPRLFFPDEICEDGVGPASLDDCPECLHDVMCDDDDECTDDHCDTDGSAGYGIGVCYYVDLYDPMTECCNAANGWTKVCDGDKTTSCMQDSDCAPTPGGPCMNWFDDGNECTADSCEMFCTVGGDPCDEDADCPGGANFCRGTGVPIHDPLTGEPCTHPDLCVTNEFCDAGVCVGELPNIFCLEDTVCPAGWFCDLQNHQCDCAAGDCDGDGLPDPCAIDCADFDGACNLPGCGQEDDCNSNRIPDGCDIDDGTSFDLNENRVPAECEQECADPPSDMVAWWPLDELVLPIAYDIVGGQHGMHGPLIDRPTPVPEGKVGGALSFDGEDDHVGSWDDGSLDFGPGSGTIDAWIKTTDEDGGTIFAKATPGLLPSVQFYISPEGKLTFELSDGYNNYDCQALGEPVNDGDWHHVAATLARGGSGDDTVQFYVDGVPRGTPVVLVSPAYIGAPDQRFLIGASLNSSGDPEDFFDGVIDEVEIFNRALDEAEIDAIFDAHGAGKCKCVDPPSDMAAWWPLDEPLGPTARDIVGGKDGTHIDEPAPLPDGKVGGALSFDGEYDYVEALDDGSLNFGMGEGTIDAWIRTLDTDGGTIFAKGPYPWSALLLMHSDGRVAFEFCAGPCYAPVMTVAPLNDNNWHHVAATLTRGESDQLTVRIYVDGVMHAMLDHGPVEYIGALEPVVLIGARYDTPGEVHSAFDGAIDEVQIFKRALDEEEIRAIYRAGSAGKCRPADVEVELVVRNDESGIDYSETLPESDSAITAGDPFVVELWASDSGVENTGLVCAYVDLYFDPELVQVAGIEHPYFSFLTDPSYSNDIDNDIGRIMDLGGMHVPPDDCVGVEPYWVRVAVVTFDFNADPLYNIDHLGDLNPVAFVTRTHSEPQPLGIGLCDDGDNTMPESVAYGAAAVDIKHNVYDLDPDCLINTSDLGPFGGCFGECEPTLGDPEWWAPGGCHESDFDCTGCVIAGDVGWFAAGWLKRCYEIPQEDWPPCRRTGGGAGREEASDDGEVLIRWSTVATGQQGRDRSVKPRRLRTGHRAGDQFDVQLWVRDDTTDSRGLSAVF
ncbi:MAG: LamG domain-containing protein, partial [Phycisphaerales bacterium]